MSKGGLGALRFSFPPRLETERLTLRAYRLEDFEAFAAYFASPRARFTEGPVSRAQAWDLFASGLGRWALVGYGAWSLERRSDGELVGLVSLNSPVVLDEPELGWILYEGHEGNGYAQEGALRARDFAFAVLGLGGLLSGIHRDNERSIQLAQSLGAQADPMAALEDEPETVFYRHPVRRV